MDRVKRLPALLLLVCLCFSLCTLAGCGEEEKLKPTDKFFVNDFADVIDESDENTMYKKGVLLQENTKAQVVAVTVDSLKGQDISDYAVNLGREWELGDKEKNNGVLILLAVEDRQIYIAVGYGLEGALPDSKTGRILDNYTIPYLRDDNFSSGILGAYNAVYNEVCIEYGVPADKGYIPAEQLPQNSSSEETTDVKTVIISWIILFVIVLIYSFVFRKRGMMFIPMGGFGPRGGSGGFGGGGFGGFSGGGGSFGGGGAGRSF